MNALTTITTPSILTMSSLEISNLVESRHDNVKTTIERLAKRGVITLPALQETSFIDTAGKKQWTTAYCVGKRDSYIVVAQLSPEFTARLVDRWQELEEQVKAPALPNFSDPVIAARAWADQYEKRQVTHMSRWGYP